MNPDDFEKRLQSQPLRQIPGEWRAKILEEAKSSRRSSLDTGHSWLSTLSHQLSTLLWPHPKAWAALAATWIVIAAMQLASSDRTQNIAKTAAPPSPETIVLLQQQNQLLAELFEPAAARDVDRPKHNLNQPRSERRMNALFA